MIEEAPVGPTRRFTIRDLLVVITVVAVLLALMLPMVRDLTEDSRRNTCSNHFKMVLLGMHNYHSAYKQLPSAMAGTGDNANRLSGLVALSPFCEAQPVWEEIAFPKQVGRKFYPAMGPVPWDKTYPPWQERIDDFICPSDPQPKAHPFGRTNYVFCIGDAMTNIHAAGKPRDRIRGLFSPRIFMRFRDNLDGLSNTIAMTEVASARQRRVSGQFAVDMPPSLAVPKDCLTTVDPQQPMYYSSKVTLSDLGRGGNWADGAGGYGLVQTILPPNSPSCAIGGTAEVDGIYSASSRHAGGCHVAMADGRVLFMTDSIDAGDASVPPPTDAGQASPYGLWGKLGSRCGKETIPRSFHE